MQINISKLRICCQRIILECSIFASVTRPNPFTKVGLIGLTDIIHNYVIAGMTEILDYCFDIDQSDENY
jgi:hypothetical protein